MHCEGSEAAEGEPADLLIGAAPRGQQESQNIRMASLEGTSGSGGRTNNSEAINVDLNTDELINDAFFGFACKKGSERSQHGERRQRRHGSWSTPCESSDAQLKAYKV